MDDMSEADRIERDLAKTRARMDHRLDELQTHLTPKQMLNDAFASFRGGEGADFTNDLIGKIKANPIPVALAGIGIAWLMASSSHPAGSSIGQTPKKPSPYGDDLEARLRLAEGNVDRSAHDDDDSYSGRLDEARGKVLGLTRDASDTAASYATRVKDAVAATMQSVRETSHDLTSSTSSTLGQLGDRVSSHGTKIQEGTQTMARSTSNVLSSVTSNPFALGALAAVVGLVAGSLIPTSDEEEHALGSVATKLRASGRDLAQDVVDRGGRIANDTLGAVKDSAEAHGLTSGKPIGEVLSDVKSGALVDQVKHVANETLQAGKDSAHARITE